MKYTKWLCMAGLLLLASACEKEKFKETTSFNFNATIEHLTNVDDSKVTLFKEQWIYWQVGDTISIGSNATTTNEAPDKADLINASPGTDFEDFNGVFLTTLPPESKYFLGLHPKSTNNRIIGSGSDSDPSFPTVHIDLPAVQPKGLDTTFSRDVFPMVAWYGGHWDDNPGSTPFNLNFHALAGIVRLQLFNASGTDKSLKEITLTSIDASPKQLVGLFNVDNYNTDDPSLTALANTAANQTVTIDCDGLSFPASGDNTLRTFYITLPAYGGRTVTTSFHLRMTVKTTNNETCTRDFTVPLRRTGITNMRALGINTWDGSNGTVIGLAGNGTEERPFKVYTLADLKYLRACYNSPMRLINNSHAISSDTYVRLMRSDIVLTTSSWDEPITHFVGHMTAASFSSTPGITNNSIYPIFNEIDDGGYVEGLTVKSDADFTQVVGVGVTPFCMYNYGTIKDCNVISPTGITTQNIGLAGLVVINQSTGRTTGCRCEANITAHNDASVAGICLTNSGIIEGCQASSPMIVTSAFSAAGICLTNNASGIVRDSYFATTIPSGSTHWGGIVYSNAGTVEKCYFSSTASIITSTSVGGIVHTLSGASSKVDNCRIDGPVRGAEAAGIVDSLKGGLVINCYADAPEAQVLGNAAATAIVGGLVGVMTGGSLKNSYAHTVNVAKYNESGDYVGGAVAKATGGTVDNCYAYVASASNFYGSSTTATYSHCYLVGGSAQTGITVVTTAQASSLSGDGLTSLLNANIPSGGRVWELSGTAPIFQP